MSEPKRSQCRFVLRDIREWEINVETGYDIFEPTVSLVLAGKNAFEPFGISGFEHPVIMHSLENFLRETLRLTQQADSKSDSQYRYWFQGTGFGLKLIRSQTNLDVHVEVDGHYGPVQDVAKLPQSMVVGRVTVREWVEGIVTLATELLALFQSHDPKGYPVLKDLESKTQAVRDWLNSGSKTGDF